MKKFLSIVMAILLFTIMVGCSNSENVTKKKESTEEKAIVGENDSTEEKIKNGTFIPTAKVNEPFLVKTKYGDYKITFEKARITDKRDSKSEIEAKEVVFLDYTYENISFKDKGPLLISDNNISVNSDEGHSLLQYPVKDEKRVPKPAKVGEKTRATQAYALNSDSKNIKVRFARDSDDSAGKINNVCEVVLPIEK